jgi:iron-sulfur cluster assembly protein
MELTITEKAATELKKAIEGQTETEFAGLRLGVMDGGCCGAKYTLSLADTTGTDETVAESQGIKVFVPAASADTLKGTVIDFVTTPQGSGFHISQPTAEATGGGCGCGGHGHGGGHGQGHGGGHGHGGQESGGGCACGAQGGGCGSGGCGC